MSPGGACQNACKNDPRERGADAGCAQERGGELVSDVRFLFCFCLFIYLEHERGRERERIPSRLHAVSTELNMRLDPMTLGS